VLHGISLQKIRQENFRIHAGDELPTLLMSRVSNPTPYTGSSRIHAWSIVNSQLTIVNCSLFYQFICGASPRSFLGKFLYNISFYIIGENVLAAQTRNFRHHRSTHSVFMKHSSNLPGQYPTKTCGKISVDYHDFLNIFG